MFCFPCSAALELVLLFESTLEDHARPPAARNAGRPSHGWVSPPRPCRAIRFEPARWEMPLLVKQYALRGLLVLPRQRLHGVKAAPKSNSESVLNPHVFQMSRDFKTERGRAAGPKRKVLQGQFFCGDSRCVVRKTCPKM